MSAATLVSLIFNPICHILVVMLVSFFRSSRKLMLFVLLETSLIFFSPLPKFLLTIIESQVPGKNPTKSLPVVYIGGDCLLLDKETQNLGSYSCSLRAIGALRLALKVDAPYVILSGFTPKGRLRDFHSETETLKQVFREFGYKKEIILESQSRNTFQNAEKSKEILEQKATKEFYLVTSASHSLRAKVAFQKNGLDPVVVPVDYTPYKGRHWSGTIGWLNYRMWQKIVHESVGLAYYKFRY